MRKLGYGERDSYIKYVDKTRLKIYDLLSEMDIKSRRDFQNVYNEIMNGVKSSIRINGYNKQTNYVFESVRNFIDDVFWGNVNGWIEENGEEVKGLIELEEEK